MTDFLRIFREYKLNNSCLAKVFSLVIAGYVASFVLISLYWVLGFRAYPYDTIFFTPADRWMDFFNNTKIPDFYPQFWTLPPMALLICSFQKLLVSVLGETVGLWLFLAGQFGLLAVSIFKLAELLTTDRKIPFYCALLTLSLFPSLVALDRGHFAPLVVALIALGMRCYLRYCFFQSTIFFAAAAAIKITPFAFLLLFANKSRVKYFFFLIFLASLFWGGSHLLMVKYIYSDYSFSTWLNGAKLYTELHIVGPWGDDFNSSIWVFFKRFGGALGIQAKTLLPVFYLLFLGIGFRLLYLFWKETYSFSTALTVIICYITISQPVTADYYLILFSLPLVFAVCRTSRPDVLVLLILLLMTPKNIFVFDLRLSSLVNGIIVCLIWAYAVSERFRRLFPNSSREADRSSLVTDAVMIRL